MKYRILKNDKKYKVQHRVFFIWLDCFIYDGEFDIHFLAQFDTFVEAREFVEEKKGYNDGKWQVIHIE